MNPLDEPITLRKFLDACEAASKERGYATVKGMIKHLAPEPEHTDYVRVNASQSGHTTVVRIASQPTRRVQVGDLVTACTNSMGLPRVTRVVAIDIPKPQGMQFVGDAVAISPEDAVRIEDVLGDSL